MNKKIFIVVINRSDDDGELTQEVEVFTNHQQALDYLHDVHESELKWFTDAVYDPESIDDDYSDGSGYFELTDMDCSGLKSVGQVFEKDIELSVSDIFPETNSMGTQLKMMTLEDFMSENKLSARELARQLECSFSRICNYLTGKTPITKSFTKLVREKYNIEIIA